VAELHPGLYEQLVTHGLAEHLRLIPDELVSRDPLDAADAHEILSRHLTALVSRALRSAGGADGAAVARQVRLANDIARAVDALAPSVGDRDDLVAPGGDVLMALAAPAVLPTGAVRFPERPEVPLSATALLVNGRDQPRIGTEVQRELASADEVDLLCAFVKWHGVRVLEEHLAALARRGGRLRVITTTYMGATERRALDRLVELGAEVKVSYETRTTRLHAKAWLFRRATGFSTAYVGSSNLSRSALLDGLEWNVRLSAVDQGHLLDTFAATFDEYWLDPAFEPYDPSRAGDVDRLDEALAAEGAGPSDLPIELTTLDVRPWGYQREILDELEALRTVHGQWRNLVVMATGTGKTVVAGLDYRRLRDAGQVDSVLFVAHREEILSQSLSTFRHVLRDGSFGERFVAGDRPRDWRHVFASVQSLARLDLERELAADRFDMVIVDEFHHASTENRTYASLLRHLRPKVLLGLTATPERTDGVDVRSWFDAAGGVELRLWEALERGLLCPFQYFGVHDDVDLRDVTWRRGQGYDTAALTARYTVHDGRVRLIAQAVADKVNDPRRMRAIGFCVSIDHAEFMARRFEELSGIPALAVTSRTPRDERRAALSALSRRDVNILFTVDLFNEGIDLPEIDTVLFLRPTESATVFLQQLGRGLRLADDKPCLTVLDFIGQQHAEFRFDLRFRALTGVTRRALARQLERGFPTLPPGCHIDLDRVSSEIVLQNLRSALRVDWEGLAAELRRVGPCTLADFLTETGVNLDDIYRRRRGGWTGLKRQAGLEVSEPSVDDALLAGAIGRLLHVDDPDRLGAYAQLLRDARVARPRSPRQQRLALMLHFALWGAHASPDDLDASLRRAASDEARAQELSELIDVLAQQRRRVVRPLDLAGAVPLHVHASYSRDEALAAFGVTNPGTVRQGVKWVEAERADVFFVTLRKTERHYSPTTMYQDRALSPSLFQWESQSLTSEQSPTGQRYRHHVREGSSIHLFLRETKESDGDLGAPPYVYAGPATYVSHTRDRPMRIVWRLAHELPADVFHAARTAVG
jgi:superfamily II DNA or RNA helicase/HKD family nuclease